MPTTRTRVTSEKAPCGRIVDGERCQDRDDGRLISDELFHACGCRSLRHECHDGGVSNKVVRHDGAAIAIAEAHPRLRIAVVSKVYPIRSHTVSAEGGAAGVVRPDDSLDEHAYDPISGGDWPCDQDAVEAFVKEAPEEPLRLEHWGCPWSREPDGRIGVRPFGGMKKMRTWFAADKTGFHMLHTLFQTSLRHASVVRYNEWFVTGLLVDDGRVQGVTAIELVLAFRAGAPLKDMEFVQYHPTGLPFTGVLITEAARAEGGWLVNKDGYRYLQDYNLGHLEPKPVLRSMDLGPQCHSGVRPDAPDSTLSARRPPRNLCQVWNVWALDATGRNLEPLPAISP